MEARSPQWMGEVRAPLPALPGTPLRDDPAYQRKGTAHMFRACAPCIGQRSTTVTAQRTQGDWAILSEHLVINMIRMGKKFVWGWPISIPIPQRLCRQLLRRRRRKGSRRKERSMLLPNTAGGATWRRVHAAICVGNALGVVSRPRPHAAKRSARGTPNGTRSMPRPMGS
jgi:hypothetical protein